MTQRSRRVEATDAIGRRRGRGDGGSSLVAAVAILFAFTFVGLVWLARDVDRGISNRSAAQSIAFQAARSGAQSSSIARVRAGDVVALDGTAARAAAQQTAGALFASYGVSGRVTAIEVQANSVTVRVEIVDGSQTVNGVGTVRAERSP